MPIIEGTEECFETEMNAYGRSGQLFFKDDGRCDCCHSHGLVACFDNSEFEYGYIQICEACIQSRFVTAHDLSKQHPNRVKP